MYETFSNENIHTGVPFSSLVTVFDYQVAFQVCGWLVCGVRNIQPQLSPQQHASRTLQAQAPLCQLIATCGDCQPHFTVIYQRVANLPFKEKGKVDLKHFAQRRHQSAYVVSLWDNGRPLSQGRDSGARRRWSDLGRPGAPH